MNDGYYFSFIIWKDYNCIKWYSFDWNNSNRKFYSYDASVGGFYQSTLSPKITSLSASSLQSDVWGAAKNLGQGLATNSGTSSYGWTVIGCQNSATYYYGYFCAKEFALLTTFGFSPTLWGTGMLLQTRWYAMIFIILILTHKWIDCSQSFFKYKIKGIFTFRWSYRDQTKININLENIHPFHVMKSYLKSKMKNNSLILNINKIKVNQTLLWACYVYNYLCFPNLPKIFQFNLWLKCFNQPKEQKYCHS